LDKHINNYVVYRA